jgi:apolipoprotein N-acyltransferase
MMRIAEKLRALLPDRFLTIASLLSAALGAVAFPDFEIDLLVMIALTPMLVAVGRSVPNRTPAFIAGWLFGFLFFFSTSWWLAHAPIEYASVNPIAAYALIGVVTLIAGVFPAIFLSLLAGLVKRVGPVGLLATPFIWLFTDLLRYHITGNNWNSLGYALAFSDLVGLASVGGVALLTFLTALCATTCALLVLRLGWGEDLNVAHPRLALLGCWLSVVILIASAISIGDDSPAEGDRTLRVVTVQPNVPMDGLDMEEFRTLLGTHLRLAGNEMRKIDGAEDVLVVFPESPMLFRYGSDESLRSLFARYTLTNDVSLMFNSMEWTPDSTGITNSALVVGPTGKLTARYDKYHLLPFGEFSPLPGPLGEYLPSFVGSFTAGTSLEPIAVGTLRAGVMICFETHFGSLSRTYAEKDADFLIEMTNDGYLGKTPVLRQHLANSVLRAVETGLPLVRSTNVGITALIEPDGDVIDDAPVYTEASRQWLIRSSNRTPTPFTRFGFVFFWLCSSIGLALSFVSLRKGRTSVRNSR